LAENIYIINKITEALLDANNVAGLEVDTEKSRCMFMSHHQNTGDNHNITIAIKSFKHVAEVKYLGKRNQNVYHKEIKSKLNLKNACYHSLQNFLSSCLLPKYKD
jgi:hypothetical protein